jgi:hypothetical protein
MCWGTKHAWTGAVRLAREPDPSGRKQLREAADKSWRAATVGKKPSNRISYPKKTAGIDAVVADLVDWLAEDYQKRDRSSSATGVGDDGRTDGSGSPTVETLPLTTDAAPETVDDPGSLSPRPGTTATTGPPPGSSGDERPPQPPRRSSVVEEIEQFSTALTKNALEEIERVHHGPVPQATKVALADHFWCDLLAQIAHVIDVGINLIDDIPDRITKLILTSREEQGRLKLEEFVIKAAVKSVWKSLQHLTFFGWLTQFRKLLPMVRILAILICKAPERHREVVEYCVDPLANQVSAETKARLLKVLREWLPEMAAA